MPTHQNTSSVWQGFGQGICERLGPYLDAVTVTGAESRLQSVAYCHWCHSLTEYSHTVAQTYKQQSNLQHTEEEDSAQT